MLCRRGEADTGRILEVSPSTTRSRRVTDKGPDAGILRRQWRLVAVGHSRAISWFSKDVVDMLALQRMGGVVISNLTSGRAK